MESVEKVRFAGFLLRLLGFYFCVFALSYAIPNAVSFAVSFREVLEGVHQYFPTEWLAALLGDQVMLGFGIYLLTKTERLVERFRPHFAPEAEEF